jgi:uncharacterized Zn-binding protein involved in type VI secretion
MPAVARSLNRDRILTGHTCSATASIQGSLQGLVTIRGIPVAVAGDAIGPHTIRAGKYCIPHGAIVNTGSTLVSAAGIPVARVGDSADAGTVISGSWMVWAM